MEHSNAPSWSAAMTTLFVTHQKEDLHPTETQYAHRYWTGARLTAEYFFLVQGTNKKGEFERCMFSDPARMVKSLRDLSHHAIAQATVVHWPQGQTQWSAESIRYVLSNPAHTHFKVKTVSRMLNFKSDLAKAEDQAGPFWLVYSDGQETEPK